MTSSHRLAITGAGWTTPLGDDLDAVWRRLLAGETGIQPREFEPRGLRLRNDRAAIVSSVPMSEDPAQRMAAIAEGAIVRAMAGAGCDPRDPGVQIVFGTSLGAFLDGEARPLHAWADEMGNRLGAARAPIALSTACSAGSDAILVGAELVRSGAARRAVAGGADVFTLAKQLGHSALGTLSPTTLRAFDVAHDGTLLGEGAGFLVLESERDASHPPLAYLRGVGSANDAFGMTAPEEGALGARLALERSLHDAGVQPDVIGIINAHGSGTPLNDATEAKALRAVFGSRGPNVPTVREGPMVFATKGNFGHALGATGALEAIALVLSLARRQVPPIVGLEEPAPEVAFPLAARRVVRHRERFGLSLTLGFGGFDTSLVMEAA
jgi:3-oxoacyl-[acyl-carrier-protein] synthase II